MGLDRLGERQAIVSKLRALTIQHVPVQRAQPLGHLLQADPMPLAVEEGQCEQRHRDRTHGHVPTKALAQQARRRHLWRRDSSVADIIQQPEGRHISRHRRVVRCLRVGRTNPVAKA